MNTNIEALKADIDASIIKTHEDMISWFARRAAWHRAQGHVERAEELDAKAAKWRAKLQLYKSEWGL